MAGNPGLDRGVIRPAVTGDIPKLVEMSKRFFDASGYSDITEFDEFSMHATLSALIGNQNAVVLVVVKSIPVGMACALIYPFYFNAGHTTAQELFWWIDPEHRGIGGNLLDAMAAGVKAKGALSLSMIALERLSPEKAGAIYERRGFRPSERSWIKKL
jgi:hypothetical protein